MTGSLQFSDCMLLLQNGMQIPNVRALRGSRNCTESSNPLPSATQSVQQRYLPVILKPALFELPCAAVAPWVLQLEEFMEPNRRI
jgi:hypothetical protein